jgi:hypothetical protein
LGASAGGFETSPPRLGDYSLPGGGVWGKRTLSQVHVTWVTGASRGSVRSWRVPKAAECHGSGWSCRSPTLCRPLARKAHAITNDGRKHAVAMTLQTRSRSNSRQSPSVPRCGPRQRCRTERSIAPLLSLCRGNSFTHPSDYQGRDSTVVQSIWPAVNQTFLPAIAEADSEAPAESIPRPTTPAILPETADR